MEFTLDRSVEILHRTPQILKAYLSDLSGDWLMGNEGGESWSPYEVLGHLIHGEKTDWIARLNIILSDSEDKTFTPFDRFAHMNPEHPPSIQELLEEFSRLRNSNLDELTRFDIQENQFGLRAIHPSLGEVNLRNLLSTWVVHDLGHIAQISRVMAHQYRDQVGPWTEYLRVLHG
jgi:hypothetical protein